ncbi:MAG TPA: hypothetical protein VFL85_04355 [Candidatus Saccharimonadales bacterium]|nr:hypothetical protein [Candidatus Saccharimonadales bacterium]
MSGESSPMPRMCAEGEPSARDKSVENGHGFYVAPVRAVPVRLGVKRLITDGQQVPEALGKTAIEEDEQ